MEHGKDFEAGMVSTLQSARRVEPWELFINVGMLDEWRKILLGASMEHRVWGN